LQKTTLISRSTSNVHHLTLITIFYNNNIPNELTTNDKTLQNGGTIRAQKWKATTVRRQFGYRIVVSKCIYDNNKTAPGRY
jgi:hypothetical protein